MAPPSTHVPGVGTVELQVRRAPNGSGTNTPVLENVLRIPLHDTQWIHL